MLLIEFSKSKPLPSSAVRDLTLHLLHWNQWSTALGCSTAFGVSHSAHHSGAHALVYSSYWSYDGTCIACVPCQLWTNGFCLHFLYTANVTSQETNAWCSKKERTWAREGPFQLRFANLDQTQGEVVGNERCVYSTNRTLCPAYIIPHCPVWILQFCS